MGDKSGIYLAVLVDVVCILRPNTYTVHHDPFHICIYFPVGMHLKRTLDRLHFSRRMVESHAFDVVHTLSFDYHRYSLFLPRLSSQWMPLTISAQFGFTFRHEGGCVAIGRSYTCKYFIWFIWIQTVTSLCYCYIFQREYKIWFECWGGASCMYAFRKHFVRYCWRVRLLCVFFRCVQFPSSKHEK